MGRKVFQALSLFLVLFYSVTSTIFLEAFHEQNLCKLHLTDGDFKEFRSGIFKLRNCAKQFGSPRLELKLQNCSLSAFPNGSFSDFGYLTSFKLELGDGSKVQLLSPQLPGYSLFEKSQFGHAILDINDLTTLIGWNWTVLAGLIPDPALGLEVNIVRSKLVYLHSDFGSIAKDRLTVVRILKCQLRWLGKDVFASFTGLKTLELRDNLIEAIERSNLPRKALKLRILDLGKNRLKHLPEDIFEGFDFAQILLDGNPLKISEQQATIILGWRDFPLPLGALWPCNCNRWAKLLEKYGKGFDKEQCYIKSSKTELIYVYNMACFD